MVSRNTISIRTGFCFRLTYEHVSYSLTKDMAHILRFSYDVAMQLMLINKTTVSCSVCFSSGEEQTLTQINNIVGCSLKHGLIVKLSNTEEMIFICL